MSCPPWRSDRQNKTTIQLKTEYDQERKERTGNPKHNNILKHLRGSHSSLWYGLLVAQTGRFYLLRSSRSGTSLPCLPSPSCFRRPRFPYDRYPPPSSFPWMPPVTDCSPYSVSPRRRAKHERQNEAKKEKLNGKNGRTECKRKR